MFSYFLAEKYAQHYKSRVAFYLTKSGCSDGKPCQRKVKAFVKVKVFILKFSSKKSSTDSPNYISITNTATDASASKLSFQELFPGSRIPNCSYNF